MLHQDEFIPKRLDLVKFQKFEVAFIRDGKLLGFHDRVVAIVAGISNSTLRSAYLLSLVILLFFDGVSSRGHEVSVFSASSSGIWIHFSLDVLSKHCQELVPSLITFLFVLLEDIIGFLLLQSKVWHIECSVSRKLIVRHVSENICPPYIERNALLNFFMVETVIYKF